MEAIARRARRGFSLIEAAIVLGVVGAVIGTIWVSAANMYEEYKVSKTVEGIFTTARNIQNLISFRDGEEIGPGVNITATLLSAGVFPKDWVSDNKITTPIGSNLVAGNEVFQFYISLAPTYTSCIKMMVRATSFSAMTGNRNAGVYIGTSQNRPNLARIMIYANSVYVPYDNFPISPKQAETACLNLSGFVLYFSYTRTN